MPLVFCHHIGGICCSAARLAVNMLLACFVLPLRWWHVLLWRQTGGQCATCLLCFCHYLSGMCYYDARQASIMILPVVFCHYISGMCCFCRPTSSLCATCLLCYAARLAVIVLFAPCSFCHQNTRIVLLVPPAQLSIYLLPVVILPPE